MTEATNNKKNNKKIKIAIIIVILLSIIGSLVYIILTTDFEKMETVSNAQNIQWNSDAKLIDDRLPENYPILFITSPSSIGDNVVVTTMCLYNNGDFITLYLAMDSIDDYTEESVKTDAFLTMLQDSYKDAKETDVANLLTDNITPSDAREAYLKQYSIEDLSLETNINMTDTSSTSIDIYGCTYEKNDDKIIGTTHKYYSEQTGATKVIKDENGYSTLEWFTKINNNKEISGN